ncbi:RNA polymerase sigma-70 factor [Chitinophaga pendula]|uniref:RNA polymerase sigma-70 factor n=1 Tax=Chitinophaga TaxID=79328 RepID=UPI000BAF02FD|nr:MULTISPECIES: RNA polymerase sigma-70 factor [Chitinophaga]ASZ13364.1 RNA polymerase sigma-70 factor [Chitinophaga sp. MD30]UCJ10224.1 RNA polymerase sigma-70 factor [Chitinophaga pendula]
MRSYASHTDKELLTLCSNGDEKAFDAIYERYYITLLNIAHKKTGNLEASEELVQDIFVALYKHIPTLQKDTRLDGYLFIALKNRVLNYHRQQLSLLKKQQALMHQPPATDSATSLLEIKELQAKLAAKIQELPAQCRTVFLLSRENQLSNKEVAERLNISVNTVEQHMRKALRLLRSSLGNELALLPWLTVADTLLLLQRHTGHL